MDLEKITEIKTQLKDEGYLIYVYSYPGGMYFPDHTHQHDTIHVVLSGKMKITIDGEEHYLNPGERYQIPANLRHSAEVVGDTPVVCIDASKPSKH